MQDGPIMQKILRTILVAISILTAYLVVGFVEGWLLDEAKSRFSPYVATLIGMVVIVFLFVPLFEFMDSLTQRIVNMAAGKSAAFGRIGFYVFLALALVVLYVAYLWEWFKVWVL